MKNLILFIIILLLTTAFYKAQMDDKFYQPKKEMKPMDFKNIENIRFPV